MGKEMGREGGRERYKSFDSIILFMKFPHIIWLWLIHKRYVKYPPLSLLKSLFIIKYKTLEI